MIYVNSVDVSPSTVNLYVGTWYYNVSAEISPANADCPSVRWSSKDTKIATVNPITGYIYGKAEGETYIYASTIDGSELRDSCRVKVHNVDVTSVTVEPESIRLVVGDSVKLGATVCPPNATIKTVKWSSDNTSIAEVDENTGCVTAKAAGTANITVTSNDNNNKFDVCSVSVENSVRINAGSYSTVEIKSTPNETATTIGQFAHHTNVMLIDETPQNDVWYKVYGQMTNGSYAEGWCSGYYLEKELDFLRCIYETQPIKVRSTPIATNTDENKIGKISSGAEVELLDMSVESQDTHSWYKVRYKRIEAYVVADDADDDYEIIKKWVLLTQDVIQKKIYAATVYAEAAGQNRISKQAVAHVINNRIGMNGLWVDIEDVVSAPSQFDGYGNSMYQDAMNYYNTGIWNNPIDRAAMDECISVITPIYNCSETDITGGALYFHSNPNPEDWQYHEDYTLITVEGTEGFWFYK